MASIKSGSLKALPTDMFSVIDVDGVNNHPHESRLNKNLQRKSHLDISRTPGFVRELSCYKAGI